jgi:hypothetical protein
MFERRENVLVSPECWDDSFENLILKCSVITESGERAQTMFHDQFFGPCWTLRSYSDAMWRIYAPNGQGVRHKRSVEELRQVRALRGPRGIRGLSDILCESRLH